jgi:hypothetical protein
MLEFDISGVVGSIDGTLINIVNPGGPHAELYRDRKGKFSINVQAVCNSDGIFTNCVIKWYGSAHDSRIFDNSYLKYQLENGLVPGILIGDSGYPCLRYLLPVISNPRTPSQKR